MNTDVEKFVLEKYCNDLIYCENEILFSWKEKQCNRN